MHNYNYQQQLKKIWKDAVTRYEGGQQATEEFFDSATLAELAQIGLNTMDVFDYAEDFVTCEEPDFETFLLVHSVRRDYFLQIQKGVPSKHIIDPTELPDKQSTVRGIEWLPRIIPKAVAKLRGELPPETMYGCGGDRRFFKTHNIHPAEFLTVTRAHENEPDLIVEWVESRLAATNPKKLP